MPELPEVEFYKKEAEKCLGKEIKFTNSYYPEIVNLKNSFQGKRIAKVFRYGKYLFLQIDGNCLVMHFGMTGKLICNNKE